MRAGGFPWACESSQPELLRLHAALSNVFYQSDAAWIFFRIIHRRKPLWFDGAAFWKDVYSGFRCRLGRPGTSAAFVRRQHSTMSLGLKLRPLSTVNGPSIIYTWLMDVSTPVGSISTYLQQ